MDQNSKSNGEQNSSGYDERLQLANAHNNESEDDSCDDRYETVK